MILKHMEKRQTLWRSRAHGTWFRLCAVCLAVYISYITYLAHSSVFESAGQTMAALLLFAAKSVGVYVLLTWLCRRLCHASPKAGKTRERISWKVFLLAFVMALVLFGSTYAAAYPGGVNYDVSNQWRQVHSGEFNNWHPLFHTLLIWLLTRVRDSYPFALLVQVIVFSALLARLTATLHKRGVPAWLALAVQALVAASLPVRNTLMYLGKDSALTIAILVLTTHAVETLYSKGEWLKKPIHVLSMGLWIGTATLLRVNALFWTLPLVVGIFFAYRLVRRQTVLAAAVAVLVMAVIQGPVYGSLDVVYPDNTVEEMIGLPMTILGDVKKQEPDRLDEQTSAFLATLASDEAWQNDYALHNYNSIKFTYERELIKYTPLGDILGMTARTVLAAPRTAFEAVNGVTDLVWDITGQDEGFQYVRNSGDIESLRNAGHARLNAAGQKAVGLIERVMQLPPLRWLTCNIGVQLLLLLLVTLWALYRRGSDALLLTLPTLLYDLGTMLLLCGNDARFFQFSMTVSLPAMLALIYLPKGGEA